MFGSWTQKTALVQSSWSAVRKIWSKYKMTPPVIVNRLFEDTTQIQVSPIGYSLLNGTVASDFSGPTCVISPRRRKSSSVKTRTSET